MNTYLYTTLVFVYCKKEIFLYTYKYRTEQTCCLLLIQNKEKKLLKKRCFVLYNPQKYYWNVRSYSI